MAAWLDRQLPEGLRVLAAGAVISVPGSNVRCSCCSPDLFGRTKSHRCGSWVNCNFFGGGSLGTLHQKAKDWGVLRKFKWKFEWS